MHITRLRLVGFKSFAEPTELLIERGLTGVVGPNGCGKSNLLEALRWVMGETSHKSMRASAMDDVIFAGTSLRPSRHAAEVTIFLDNRARRAPAEFNDADSIEIARRIEREAGSSYRINGREARARDVRILFEDAATGARSPALVRQGQIAEIVNSKPEQRRRILEDAAGVAGLHSRRHEAELRLKAAEGNLARLGDILGQLSGQIESLKRQARQARRYKELSGEIRRQEALTLHLAWAASQTAVDGEEQALRGALQAVAAATLEEQRLIGEEEARAAVLPRLREAEAGRAAALARLKIAEDAFNQDARRAEARKVDLEQRRMQLLADRDRETVAAKESSELLHRLAEEARALAGTSETFTARADAIAEGERFAEGRVAEVEAELAELNRRLVAAASARQSRVASLQERRAEADRLCRQLDQVAAEHDGVVARAPDAQQLERTRREAARLDGEIADLESGLPALEADTEAAARTAAGTRERLGEVRLALAEVTSERSTLTKLLAPANADGLAPVVDAIRVEPGYEVALGAALGDDLEAPVGEYGAVRWRRVDPADADGHLPSEADPLIRHVEAPPELARRLSQVGVVEPGRGGALQQRLAPGQRLVSRQGALWRWDGFTADAEAPTPAALRLAERNRLSSIVAREAELTSAVAAALGELQSNEGARLAAEVALREARARLRAIKGEREKLAGALGQFERAARETEQRLAALRETRSRLDAAARDAGLRIGEAERELAALGPVEDFSAELAERAAAARSARAALADARAERAALEREEHAQLERLEAIGSEQQRWRSRHDSASAQIEQLAARLAELAPAIAELADLPAVLAEKRERLAVELAAAERHRQAAADALSAGEAEHRKAQAALRSAQAELSAAREAKARVEAMLEAARNRRAEEARRIREALGCAPEQCLDIAAVPEGRKLPGLETAERDLSRMKADRERLGGVNLEADGELEAIQAQHVGLDRERADVEAAIAKLRGAIQQLNREGRKRLAEAFQSVDGHFRRLFATLFGGGEARLEMIESEDPLEGGLEIIAKPPGKKPATLSLLSGGEQTLTALSLIFAVFLTNPSPICVLDEVDAPLDDANVDRFCTLMERMAADTDTRFLVITHHPMTMARMHRLFGVTMAEKGISQLVSVDLQTAESLIEAKAS